MQHARHYVSLRSTEVRLTIPQCLLPASMLHLKLGISVQIPLQCTFTLSLPAWHHTCLAIYGLLYSLLICPDFAPYNLHAAPVIINPSTAWSYLFPTRCVWQNLEPLPSTFTWVIEIWIQRDDHINRRSNSFQFLLIYCRSLVVKQKWRCHVTFASNGKGRTRNKLAAFRHQNVTTFCVLISNDLLVSHSTKYTCCSHVISACCCPRPT